MLPMAGLGAAAAVIAGMVAGMDNFMKPGPKVKPDKVIPRSTKSRWARYGEFFERFERPPEKPRTTKSRWGGYG